MLVQLQFVKVKTSLLYRSPMSSEDFHHAWIPLLFFPALIFTITSMRIVVLICTSVHKTLKPVVLLSVDPEILGSKGISGSQTEHLESANIILQNSHQCYSKALIALITITVSSELSSLTASSHLLNISSRGGKYESYSWGDVPRAHPHFITATAQQQLTYFLLKHKWILFLRTGGHSNQ